ncbi:hypothetical protein AK830_g46 [Neonectria ditissima]|uniref:non-specific serine/threonine protein kinase n=1 Tax=Neonectria ditissima TaxID=78410 RepID=A0A0P7BWW6_9HYPO|nr:hypothetical protein AK830_g46 [Neonectria ditissima]
MSYDSPLIKREAETMSRISHQRNIVEYIGAQPGDGYFDIMMELKFGNVQGLINGGLFIQQPTSIDPLLLQVLQALNYLASESIIHRDVKPENILYTPLTTGSYLYQLGDFGLANLVVHQTPKMDVWSLFVTLTYAVNIRDFQSKPLHTTALRVQAIQDAAADDILRPIRFMAEVDLSHRATAGDVLDCVFNGAGRTTRRKQAPDTATGSYEEQLQPLETLVEGQCRGNRDSPVKRIPPGEAAASMRGKRLMTATHTTGK